MTTFDFSDAAILGNIHGHLLAVEVNPTYDPGTQLILTVGSRVVTLSPVESGGYGGESRIRDIALYAVNMNAALLANMEITWEFPAPRPVQDGPDQWEERTVRIHAEGLTLLTFTLEAFENSREFTVSD